MDATLIQLLVAFHFKEKRNALAVEGPEKKEECVVKIFLILSPIHLII